MFIIALDVILYLNNERELGNHANYQRKAYSLKLTSSSYSEHFFQLIELDIVPSVDLEISVGVGVQFLVESTFVSGNKELLLVADTVIRGESNQADLGNFSAIISFPFKLDNAPSGILLGNSFDELLKSFISFSNLFDFNFSSILRWLHDDVSVCSLESEFLVCSENIIADFNS